jgi:type I restriction enzyme S subunit
MSEQSNISEVFQACDAKITTLGKEITLHEELFRALIDELMTGRISTLPFVEQLEKGTLSYGQRTGDGTGAAD